MSAFPTVRDRLFTTAVCLGFVLVQLDVSIVNVGLEALRQSYKASITDLEWVINTYSLLFAAMLLSSGRLGERFGVRRIFVTGVTIFIVASLCCAFATQLIWLDIARGIQGIGAALLVPSSLTLIRHYFSEPRQMTVAIGLWAASGGFSLAAGPVMGGTLIKLFGWKSIFLINVPVGLACIFIALKFAPQGSKIAMRFNVRGQVLVAAALGLLTFSLTETGHYGLLHKVPMLSLAAGLLSFALFVYYEKHSENPVVEPIILKSNTIRSALLIGFLCNLVFYGGIFVLSIFFQTGLQLSPFETGWSFLPMMLFTASVNFSSGWLSRYFKIRTLVSSGAIISFTGFGLMLFVQTDWNVWQMVIPMMLMGAGTSLSVPAMTNLIFSEVSQKDAGSASALFSCARQIGGVTGIALFGLLITLAGPGELITGISFVVYAALILIFIWLFAGYKNLAS